MIRMRPSGFRRRLRSERATIHASRRHSCGSHAAMPQTRGCVRPYCVLLSRRPLRCWSNCGMTWRNEGPRRLRMIAVALFDQLAQLVGARKERREIDRVLDRLAAKSSDAGTGELRDRLVQALARGARRAGGRLGAGTEGKRPGARLLAGLIGDTKGAVLDRDGTEAARAAAIGRLVLLEPVEAGAVLVELLEPREPPVVQVAAVRGSSRDRFSRRGQDSVAAAARIRAVRAHRRGWNVVEPRGLDQGVARVHQWGRSGERPGPGLDRGHGSRAAPQTPGCRDRRAGAEAVREARGSITREGDFRLRDGDQDRRGSRRGARVFERECKACHKIGEQGFELGPDLTGSPSRDPAALLTNILDPNASVPPKDVQYVLVDQNGRTYSGLIASQTATSLTLKRGDGAQDTILRGQVAEISSTGLSLMPEGFEKRISKPEMADLIAYLCASHRGGDSRDDPGQDVRRPLDIGTLPGLIEPDE